MSLTRRQFLNTTTSAVVASAAGITVMPFAAQAAAHGNHSFDTGMGMLKVHPVNHASIVLETPKGAIYVDPVGEAAQYADMPKPDMILITHQHGDHFNAELLAQIKGDAPMITNPAVAGMLPDGMQATAIGNGDTSVWNDMRIEAIPAYNMTEERKKFHPQGRDNGYVLNMGSFRLYISGDTEDIPEMRGLKDIDLAFVCMNLPFTMPATAAADAVADFRPKVVYPYHYRGRDGGTQDPQEFASLVGDAAEVRLGDWY